MLRLGLVPPFHRTCLAWVLFATASLSCNARRTAPVERAPTSPDVPVEVANQPVVDLFAFKTPTTPEGQRPMSHARLKLNPTATDRAAYERPLASLAQPVLVTVEAMPEGADGLAKIAAGGFDAATRALCEALGALKGRAFVRWNPEMEVPGNVFPWQNQSPLAYIEAFQKLTTTCRAVASNVNIVWGPAGYPGDTEYFPGSAFVDWASVTLESPSEAALADATHNREPLAAALRTKLHRLRFIDKPVLVLAGSPSAQQAYQPAMLETFRQEVAATRGSVYRDDNFIEPGKQTWQRNGAKPILGVYDPKLTIAQGRAVQVEHLFTDWNGVRDGSLAEAVAGAASRGHDVIVTLEPWKDGELERDPQLFARLRAGHYDALLRSVFALVARTPRTFYLRWAHEMEIPITRYAWQSQDPAEYIEAFRYVANFAQPRPSNLRLVWGPAGDRNSLAFWPGADVVDFVSVAIYGLPDKNITDHRQQEQFRAIFDRKLYRMRFLNKPVFVTEMGVMGPDDYQREWLHGAAKTLHDNPQVQGVCYFNLSDVPGAWGDIEAPNWSVSKAAFKDFTETLLAP